MLKKKRVLAAKIETTPGTAVSLANADAGFNVWDVEVPPDIPFNQRSSPGSASKLPGVTGPRAGNLTFKSHLYGDGAAGTPAWASTFLPACGMVVSTGTFAPKTAAPGTDNKTLTMGVYHDGGLKQIRGAVGSFKITGEAGQPFVIEWNFRGVWDAPTDVAILSPTLPTTMPLRFANSTYTVGGSAISCAPKLEFDLGNTLHLRPCPTDVSGYAAGVVSNRDVTGSMDPESVLVATRDIYGQWIGHTELALSMSVTDGTDTITIAAPQIQYKNIQEGEREMVQTDEITFDCNAASSAGDDEFTIDFS